jgi:hypothetical protein
VRGRSLNKGSARIYLDFFSSDCLPGAQGSTPHRVEVLDVDGISISEQHHEYREPDRRLRRGDRKDKEDEYLAGDIAVEVGKGDKVHIHGEQHQFDAHQQDNDVLPVDEDTGDAETEKYGPDEQKMC